MIKPESQTTCTHGKAFSEDCYDCDKVWERDMLEISKQHVKEHERNLERLEAKKRDKI